MIKYKSISLYIFLLLAFSMEIYAENYQIESNIIELKNNKIYYDKNIHSLYNLYNNKIYVYKDNYLKNITNTRNVIQKKIKTILSNKETIIIQTKDNQFIAIDKKTNKTKWKKNINNKVFFKPIIDKDRIFIDVNGKILAAFNIDTGNLIWKYDNIMEDYTIYTNGKILQDSNNIMYIFSNKKILILSKNTGDKINSIKIKSEREFDQGKNLKFISDVSIYNTIIYICYDDGNLISYDMITGNLLLEKTKKNYTNILIEKTNLLIIKKNGHITLLNKFNGKKIWTNKDLVNVSLSNPIIIKEKTILIGDSNGFIHFIDIFNGKINKSIKISKNKINKIFFKKNNKTNYMLSDKNIINFKVK